VSGVFGGRKGMSDHLLRLLNALDVVVLALLKRVKIDL